MEITIERAHPHATMGEFVYNYVNLIRPRLREGDIEAPMGCVKDAQIRAVGFGDLPGVSRDNAKPGSYLRYIGAIRQMVALCSSRSSSGSGFELMIRAIDRDVNELDFILREDQIYEKYRKRQEDFENK